MKDKTGGPAFPWCGDLNECPTINLGMSLRDYFAAAILPTVVGEVNIAGSVLPREMALRDEAKDSAMIAYIYADAMLAEREK